MPIRPLEFDRIAEALSRELDGLPGKLIAIDGSDGSGKSTLGRFLAWYFNVSLVEADLFLIDGSGLCHHTKEVARIITKRLEKPMPVIVEGVTVLRLLKEIGRSPDYLIYVKNTDFEGSRSLSQELSKYRNELRPEQSANIIAKVSH